MDLRLQVAVGQMKGELDGWNATTAPGRPEPNCAEVGPRTGPR